MAASQNTAMIVATNGVRCAVVVERLIGKHLLRMKGGTLLVETSNGFSADRVLLLIAINAML